MRILNGWDQVPAYEDGIERIPVGGHICRILSAKVETISNGSEKISLALEIEEGSALDGVCRRIFNGRKSGNPAAKWPCVFDQFLLDRDGLASPHFKGMIRCVEKSNPGYQWQWDENSLKGKLIGMIFREEEYESAYGDIRTTVRPAFARSTERIREGVEIPEIKRLAYARDSTGFAELPDEKLPF